MSTAHNDVRPDDVVWELLGDAPSQVSLLVLPNAGGNAHAYAPWRDQLPGQVTLLIGQYPGRGARFSEDVPASIDDLAAPIARCLPAGTGDLVVLGHSMGSLVAFEVARILTAQGRAPRALIASACRPPQIANPSPVHPGRLSDDELVAAIKARGGTDDGILDEPELREVIMPAIRADFGIDDDYRYTGGTDLDCPVTVVGGVADTLVPFEVLADWSAATTGPTRVELMPGGHFYFQHQLTTFLALVADIACQHQPA